MSNPPMYFGNIMYFITDTGATISIDDFNCLSTDQQEKCKPVYYENEKYEINPEFAEVFKEPYGWCIEWNFSSSYFNRQGKQIWVGHTNWSLYWKHKVYPTKEVCLLALKVIKTNNDSNQYIDIKYRIFPVYQGKIEEV